MKNKPMRAKCAKCHDVVEVSHFGEYKTCKCGAISLDYGDGYYSRMGGAPEDFDKEFDKENGIDRFKPFKLEKPEELDSNTDLYTFELKGQTKKKPAVIYDMNTLTTLTWNWFDKKGLKDPVMQMVKVQEEVGELAHEISRGHRNTPEVEDALGDTLVTIIGMCHHLHIHPAHALEVAYNEIKDRTGKVVEGSFIKDE